MFTNDRNREERRPGSMMPVAHIGKQPPVYLFWDFSNIGIGARQVSEQQGESIFAQNRIRIHCQNFRSLAERGRQWGSGLAAAGLRSKGDGLQRCLQQNGIQFNPCELGCVTGKEQGVDEKLQVSMYHLISHKVQPGVVVLATGDGNGHQRGEGFLSPLRLLRENGFQIELMSWKHSLNGTLREWVEQNGKVIELDRLYFELTFIEGARTVKPLGNIFRKLNRHVVC